MFWGTTASAGSADSTVILRLVEPQLTPAASPPTARASANGQKKKHNEPILPREPVDCASTDKPGVLYVRVCLSMLALQLHEPIARRTERSPVTGLMPATEKVATAECSFKEAYRQVRTLLENNSMPTAAMRTLLWRPQAPAVSPFAAFWSRNRPKGGDRRRRNCSDTRQQKAAEVVPVASPGVGSAPAQSWNFFAQERSPCLTCPLVHSYLTKMRPSLDGGLHRRC